MDEDTQREANMKGNIQKVTYIKKDIIRRDANKNQKRSIFDKAWIKRETTLI